jgi:type IV secretory pathway VirB4 component
VRTRVRLARLRATTGQACALYPFLAGPGLGALGAYVGVDHLAGGLPFAFDPFDAYAAGLVTNPNAIIVGEPGTGKSATVKAMLERTVRRGQRWIAVIDPKGEYAALADVLGLSVIRLVPGGREQVNPLERGPVGSTVSAELARRQATTLTALIGSVLGRDLEPIEDAVLAWALADLARRRGTAPTLVDLAAWFRTPSDDAAELAARTPEHLAREVEAVGFALNRLLDGTLRGMFDGPTTARVDWGGAGVVVDLSALHDDPDALRSVVVAATAWLGAMMATAATGRRILVLDEAWALLASERTARFIQSSFKLGRSNGVANIAVLHRLSDLRAQADDGTATSKVAAGLLADAATRVVFRQSADQAAEAKSLLGLTDPETELIGRLARGRALWHLGANRAVVSTDVTGIDRRLIDTDAQMRG